MHRPSPALRAITLLLIAVFPAPVLAAGVRALPLDPSTPFFGAKFEPHGVYHFAQGETQSTVVWDCDSRPGFACSDFGTIAKYQTATGEKPIGVLHYVTPADWDRGKADIQATFKGKKRIPQIGVGFWPNGEVHFDDTAAAASGAYDGFWKSLAKTLKKAKTPVFVRPGFEFGGSGAGSFYDPVTYVAAFRRMVDLFRSLGVENVAFVWDNYNEPAYMNFYPGDEYVDWWGINLFHESDFTSATVTSFMADALAHGKPVMICESSPKDRPVTDASAWPLWYGPYFDFFLQAHPHVKAFSYINSSWTGWSGFQEARIELDPATVQPMFAASIADPIVLHQDDSGGPGILFGPAISIRSGEGVAASAISSTGATITWKTLGLVKKQLGGTTSQVEYGPTLLYGLLTAEDTALVSDHAVVLSGLSPATTYHFRVRGFDASGFEIRSGDFSFTTAP